MKKLLLGTVAFLFISVMSFADGFSRKMLDDFMKKGSFIISDYEESISYIPKSAINSIELKDDSLIVYHGTSGTAFYFTLCELSLADDGSFNIIVKSKRQAGER